MVGNSKSNQAKTIPSVMILKVKVGESYGNEQQQCEWLEHTTTHPPKNKNWKNHESQQAFYTPTTGRMRQELLTEKIFFFQSIEEGIVYNWDNS